MNQKSKQCMVYVGTYTSQESKGIYGYHLDMDSGELDSIGVMADAENPSYLEFDYSKQHLYAVYETDRYQDSVGGAVGSYLVDPRKGSLTSINEQLVRGKSPCHLCVNEEKQVLVTANYNDGSLSVFPLNNDGSIGDMTDYIQHQGSGPNQERQENAHAHYVTFTPDGKSLCAVDLGIDQVKRYQLNEHNHTLSEAKELSLSIKAGSGPRHLAFHPNGRFMYVVNELSSYIVVLCIDSEGQTTMLQTIATIPTTYQGLNLCGAMKITPDGRFLYATNRGHNSLVAYGIDSLSGRLELISHTSSGGNWPRDLEIDPSGQWILVANQESDDITGFQIQKESGMLIPLGTVANISKPVCIKMMELK